MTGACRLLLCAISILAPSSIAQAGPDEPIASGDSPAAPLDQGIVGSVTGTSGQPLAGVFVEASPLVATSGPVPDIAIFTDAAGRFAWPLRSGAYRLTLLLDGRRIGEAKAAVHPREVTTLELQVD